MTNPAHFIQDSVKTKDQNGFIIAPVPQRSRSRFKTVVLGSQILGTALFLLGLHTPLASSQIQPRSATYTMSSPSTAYNVSANISQMAQAVTVRIFANRSVGSGVMIRHSGQAYTVITNAHVVGNRSSFMVLTADGQMHSGRLVSSSRDLDLAVLEFNSTRSYQIAVTARRRVGVGEPVIAAGFPNWLYSNPGRMQDTRSWGNRPFQLTLGQVGMVPNRTLVEGYQLGYTNDIRSGMSGGPVFNQQGELIGINGRSKFALSTDKVYRYSDGTSPSADLVQQMRSLSWAIPISNMQLTALNR